MVVLISSFRFRMGFVLMAVLSGCTATAPIATRDPASLDCGPPIDLRAPGNSMAGLPSGEQGDGYTCGFYAASGWVDAYRQAYLGEKFAKDGNLPSHPLALAVDLAVERNRPVWLPLQLTSDPLSTVPGRHGSLACDVMKHLRKRGVCRNEDAEVYDRAKMTDQTNRAHRIYELLYRHARTAKKKADLSKVASEVRSLLPEPAPSVEEIATLVERHRRKPYRTIRALLYPNCDDRAIGPKELDLPRCRTRIFAGLDTISLGNRDRDPARGDRAKRWMTRLLERPNALPVLATHCYAVFREGHAFDGKSLFSTNCVLHHVLVVGRREKNGKCEYLVRNSYEPEDEYRVSSDWERDGEDFWLDADAFERSLYAIQFLDGRDLDLKREEREREDAAEAKLAEWEREFGRAARSSRK